MNLRKIFQLDWVLVVTALLILGVGLLALYSLSTANDSVNYFYRQAAFALLGFVIMLALAGFDYRFFERRSTFFYFLTLAVLVAVLVFGKTVRGTSGWFEIGGFGAQPVEGAKLALIIFLASFIAKKRTELGEWTRLIASLVLSSLVIFLVLRQPDLGSALVLAAVWGVMILMSGIRLKHLLVLGVLGVGLASGSWFLLEDYQRARIDSFMHPEADPLGSGYNVLQAMVAIGSGGLTGKGVGHGSQSHLNFLPEKHTDFIYAVVAEELGVYGSLLLVVLYLVLLYRAYRIATRASDNFGYLLGTGILAMLFVQIVVNLGMNMGLLPVTGLPAPLLSYGGSSLVTVFAALGLLLSIFRRRARSEAFSVPTEPGELLYAPLSRKFRQ